MNRGCCESYHTVFNRKFGKSNEIIRVKSFQILLIAENIRAKLSESASSVKSLSRMFGDVRGTPTSYTTSSGGRSQNYGATYPRSSQGDVADRIRHIDLPAGWKTSDKSSIIFFSALHSIIFFQPRWTSLS